MATKRKIEGIYKPPPHHMVGDGFRVHGYFNVIEDAHEKLSPFLLLDYGPEYNFPPTTNMRRGVGPHPHRGFETVTIAFQGAVAHHDSTGTGGVIGPGDVQWMTAAGGILHREYHAPDYAKKGGPFQMAQIWVNLPAKHKLDKPGYQGITADQIGVAKLPAGEVRVIAGKYQYAKGPARTFTPINMYDVRLEKGGRAEFSFPAKENAAFVMMDGDATINSQKAAKHDFVLFANVGEDITVESASGARFLVLNGEPINEPVAAYGPFVMNTPKEIEQAFADFRAGKFGHLDD
jgi:redox-sensitive bicupin YhaK (pirin superfamily)